MGSKAARTLCANISDDSGSQINEWNKAGTLTAGEQYLKMIILERESMIHKLQARYCQIKETGVCA